MKNAFGLKIYEVKEVFTDPNVERCIRETIAYILNHLEISSKKTETIIEQCVNLAKNYSSVSDYEKEAHKILENLGVTQEIPKKLTNRADMIHERIKQFVIGRSILDLGCGDGKVAELFAKDGFKVVLSDVYKHDNIDFIDLPFKLFNQEEDIPFEDNFFDYVISITAIHNFTDIPKALKEISRIAKKKCKIVITILKKSPKKEEILKQIKKNFNIKETIEEDKDIINFLTQKEE